MSSTELLNVDSTMPLMHALSNKQSSYSDLLGHNDSLGQAQSEYVETDFGPVCVVKLGAAPFSGKPCIVTYHDIGLNFESNFQSFFNFCEMKVLVQSFTVLNVHAPGQEENAVPLPEDYVYPTMDQLALQVDSVCKFFGVKSFIGLGVGAGANVLSRYALNFPEMVDGLFLINATASAPGWSEWAYHKSNMYYLTNDGQRKDFPQSIQDHLMWHHFGYVSEERNQDLIRSFRKYFNGHHHCARNLRQFMNAYHTRTDLNIERIGSGGKARNFDCTALILVGALSPFVDETVEMNGRLDPTKCTWMKLQSCGMVLEEQPNKVCEAFRLFLQGLGHALTVLDRRLSTRSHSISSGDSAGGGDQRVHIVENPMLKN